MTEVIKEEENKIEMGTLIEHELAELEDLNFESEEDLTGPNNGRWKIDPSLLGPEFSDLRECTKVQLTQMESLASGISLARNLSKKNKKFTYSDVSYLKNWYGFNENENHVISVKKCGVTLYLWNSKDKIEMRFEYKELQKYLVNLVLKWVDCLQSN